MARLRAPIPRRARRPSIVVIGDLVVDVVLAPERPIESGTDVPGRVSLDRPPRSSIEPDLRGGT